VEFSLHRWFGQPAHLRVMMNSGNCFLANKTHLYTNVLQHPSGFPSFIFPLQEVNQFQNRLNRNMHECQEQARDRIQPGMENDPSKMAAIEQSLIDCMSNQVNEHIKLLQPMKNRITAALKNYK
jgi:Eukaryotic protein of unknown function (DUF842)